MFASGGRMAVGRSVPDTVVTKGLGGSGMGDRTGRRHTRRTHPVSGQVFFEGESWELRRGMQNPYPLKRCTVRLARVDDSAEWTTTTNTRGEFEFARADNGDQRGIGSLNVARDAYLTVIAHDERGLEVCHGNASNPWSFEVLQTLARDMRIVVPGKDDAADGAYLQEVNLVEALPRPTETEEVEEHHVRPAFRAFALLTEMRSWLWNNGGARRNRAFPWVRRITGLFPATSSVHLDDQLCLGADKPGGGRTGANYTLSALAHEFGHHIYESAAPRAIMPSGEHQWVMEEPRDRQGFVQRLQIDFCEGYATFIGQSFLRTRQYRYSDRADVFSGSTSDVYSLETPQHNCVAGDWPTAAFLWDLTDPGSEDPLEFSFKEIHREFALFAREQGAVRLNLFDFWDFLANSSRLQESEPDLRGKLKTVLVRNNLNDSYIRYKKNTH